MVDLFIYSPQSAAQYDFYEQKLCITVHSGDQFELFSAPNTRIPKVPKM